MKKCAIYTRKSSEEGLDQEFNSLDSQREAAEYYIKAQAHQGWQLSPEHYDDGGYSGGTADRPALQRLLADIKNNKIDVVVVYKIDRLSRSMIDFIKVMDVFDKHNVTFVSVTQHFDTNTSMGKLILNILQSFAQFERDMTRERIKDKVSASKAKGMWMGGVPPLGYDIKDKKLIINSQEEKVIKYIFDQYLSHGSLTKLLSELKEKNYKTKSWTTERGKTREGRDLDKGSLYGILKNPIYTGLIKHKDEIHQGQHEPIITPEKFENVREFLEGRRTTSLRSTNTTYLLQGLLVDQDGYAMTCTASKKPDCRYRYYTSTRAIKKSYIQSSIPSLPAKILEDTVIHFLKSPAEILASSAIQLMVSEPEYQEFIENCEDFKMIWDEVCLTEQKNILRIFIKKIQFFPQTLDITFSKTRLIDYIKTRKTSFISEEAGLKISIPFKLKKSGSRRYLTLANRSKTPCVFSDTKREAALKALAIGFDLLERINAQPDLSFAALSENEKIDRSDVAKYLRLTQLSPKIIRKLIKNECENLNFDVLYKSFPNSWAKQEAMLLG